MKEISLLRFNVLAGYVRDHRFFFTIEELEWYETENSRLLGLVARHVADDDFAYVVLGRDRLRRFRAVATEHSYPTRKKARQALRVELAKFSRMNSATFIQYDEIGEPVDIFRPLVASNKLNRGFAELSNRGVYPASRVIQEMINWYEDVDGNFVEQFQSTGFDARIWELYLFATLIEAGFAFDRTCQAPDFLCHSYGGRFFVEATTVNPSVPAIDINTLTENEYYSQYVPMKFGSALYSKLTKRYWEKEHVKGLPLLFAIQDFHDLHSMAWSSYALGEYLFGARNTKEILASGIEEIRCEPVTEYRIGEKVVPAGFFFQAGAENISAVISNPGGTLAKFNRMGYLAGFGDQIVEMVRVGTCFRRTNVEAEFESEVTSPDYAETWIEGLTVYHNPNAVIPLSPGLLPGAAHYYFDGKIVSAEFPAFHPTGSMTYTRLRGERVDAFQRNEEARKLIRARLAHQLKDKSRK